MSRSTFRPGRWLQAAGAACIVLASVANPWVLERFVLLDGRMTRPRVVLIAELLLAALGAGLLWRGRQLRDTRVPARQVGLNALTVAFSLLFSFGLAELALRFLAPADPYRFLRNEAFWETNWRKTHAEGVHELQVFDVFDPDLGWRPRPHLELMGEVGTNSIGLRAPRDFPFQKPAGVRRIVAIGDSFTWAGEIQLAENYTALLEQGIPDTEVVNLGVHGWGTDQQLVYLRKLGLRFEPDLVTLGMYEDNRVRNVLAFRDYAKPRFALVDDELELTNTPLTSPEELLVRPPSLPRSLLLDLVRTDLASLLSKTKLRPTEAQPDYQLLEKIVSVAKHESEAAGARFLLIYIPFGVQGHAYATERALAAWAARTGTAFVNTRAVFAALPESEWHTIYDGHWTPRGHEVAAAAILETIEREGLLEP